MTFQDENGFVQMAKFENSGWTLSQLDVDPVRRTGLALQPSYKANQADKLMLFHQKSNLNISLASWDPGDLIESSRLMRDADAFSFGMELQ